MAEQDRGDRPGGQTDAGWFIDFEQGDLDAEAVISQARHRPGPSGPTKPKPDAQPRVMGPSPWVADFLLNQVHGAQVEPTLRRKPVSARGERGTKQGKPAQHTTSGRGTAEAREPATTAQRVADFRKEAAGSILQPGYASPPPTIGEARTGRYGVRPYALTATLVLGLATGLWTLPQGDRQDTNPAQGDLRPAKMAVATLHSDVTREPGGVWQNLPQQAVAILQPRRIVPVSGAPAASPGEDREPIEVASLAGAPPVTPFEPAPASTQTASTPARATRIVHSSGPTATLVGATLEVTAREVDEARAVAAGPTSTEHEGPGAKAHAAPRQVAPAPETVLTPNSVASATEEGRQGNPLRAARRNDKRRQAVRPASPRLAQATQARAFALPAVLRPTSF